MHFAMLRWLQMALAARSGDAAWIRSAVAAGQEDLVGRATAVAGDTIIDRRQRYPFNMYGAATINGVTHAGEVLRLTSGAAAGQAWSLLTTIGSQLRVAGGVDLSESGVAAGDSYRIERERDARAVAFFAKSAIECVIENPLTVTQLPAFVIVADAESEVSRPIGHVGRLAGRGGAGPVIKEALSRWSISYDIVAMAKVKDATHWMGQVLDAIYRESVEWFEVLFADSSFRASASPLMPQPWQPGDVWTRSLTISGTVERYADIPQPWLVDEAVDINVSPR